MEKPYNELLPLLEQEAVERARSNFLSFVLYVREGYKLNWHHRVICDHLDRFVRGELPRLIIQTQPRSGKSELVSRHLPAFIFGRNPDANVIGTSYSADLAQLMGREVQRIIDSEQYARVFPGTALNRSNVRTVSGTWLRNSDIFEIVGHRGMYRCAGVGGGITGMGGGMSGGNYAIIDDPIKNQEEANSSTYRERVFSWYNSALQTRIHGEPQGILITLTRWHEDDLAGRVLEVARKNGDADQWVVLKFEAIKEGPPNEFDKREDGDPLWPSQFPLKKMIAIKATVPASTWNALYQQRPASPEGAIIKRDWLRYYDKLPDEIDRWWQSWDLTFDETESGSYVVGQVWCESKANCYLVHQYRERIEFTESVRAVANMSSAYPQATLKKVEKAANGSALLSVLRSKISGLVAVAPRGDKATRLMAVSPLFEAGNIWLPRRENVSWVSDYIEELVTFPKATNNDQVDATSMALADIQQSRIDAMNLDLEIGHAPSYWSGLSSPEAAPHLSPLG